MFRILVVEDLVPVREQVVKLIRESLAAVLRPDYGLQIEVAGTIEEAHTLVRQAGRAGRPYDVAILDISLPASATGEEKYDTETARTVADEMPKALVVLFTAYAKEAPVKALVDESGRQRPDRARVRLVEKGPDAKTEMLAQHVVEWAEGWVREKTCDRVKDRLDYLLGPEPGDGEGRFVRETTGPDGGGEVSRVIVALERDLREHWADLKTPLRERASRLFRIEFEGDELRAISLF